MGILQNERWELYAQKLAAGENATSAYQSVGFKRSRSNASRLSANESVRRRVCEIQAAGAKSAEVSVASLLDELETARAQAQTLGQLSAAVRATAEKARISGLLIERQQVEITQPDFTVDMSASEILQEVATKHSPESAVLLAMMFDVDGELPADLSKHRPAVAKKLEYIRGLLAEAATPISQPVSQRSIEWHPPRPDRKREIR